MEYLPLIGIALLFWLFLIRPQSRRQKELRNMQSSLSQGDEVMLTSGVFGTVEAIEDDHLRVEIADGVVIKVVRGAIGNKVAREEQVDEQTDDEPVADEQATDEHPGPEKGAEEN